MTLTDQLDSWEKVARAASPGPWRPEDEYVFDAQDCMVAEGRGEGYRISHYDQDANAAHIAAFNPQTALALIQALRVAMEALEELKDIAVSSKPEVKENYVISGKSVLRVETSQERWPAQKALAEIRRLCE